jgi:hypothetical protein
VAGLGVGSGGPSCPVSVERSLVLPGGPHDAGQTVSERYRGTISAATLLASQRPFLEPMQRSLSPPREVCGDERGARPVNQERTKINISLLGDPTQSAPTRTCGLPGGQADPGGEVPSRWEPLDIDHRG